VTTVRVDITTPEDNQLKVVWNDPEAPWGAYLINRALVEDCAKKVRSALDSMVDQALKGASAGDGGTLRQLAREGSMLHRALFLRESGEQDPAEVRDYYAAKPECRFRFRLPPGVSVPWGLIYPGVAKEVPESFSASACEPFWGLLRQSATLHERMKPNVIGSGAANLSLLRVTQTAPFKKAVAGLDGDERAFLDWIEKQYGGAVSTRESLEGIWAEKGASAGMLYFYCHANANELATDDDDPLTFTDLLLVLDSSSRPRGQSGCLMLLYGCSTAGPSNRGGFLSSANSGGFCGFVGTETKVPDVFALRFALRLIHRMFSTGETLGEAMAVMVRRHLPLSLLFSVYAHPDFRMPVAGMSLPMNDTDLIANPGTGKI